MGLRLRGVFVRLPPVGEPDGAAGGEVVDARIALDEGDVVVGEAVAKAVRVNEEREEDGGPGAAEEAAEPGQRVDIG